MPWKETCAMKERMQFVALVQEGEETMAALCRRFGISRKTGYKLLARFAAEGVNGLADRSHAAHHHAHAVSEAIEDLIVDLRHKRPSWGPRKLRLRLRELDPTQVWPAKSTIGEILRQHGLVVPRRRRRATPADALPFAGIEGPNDTWCLDYKGWFRTGDGQRCDPLTISDAYSRYLLRCQAVRRVDGRCARPLIEATFREYGLPRAIRTDNGSPFASVGVGGLSRLSVWWIKLGIRPERITPGRPCENGRHERLHRTLKRDACEPAASSRRAQQWRFDTFRGIYNNERPHEAIGDVAPSTIYRPSPRAYPARLPEVVYPDRWEIRMARSSGEIKWRGEQLFIGEALAGEPLGLEETDGGEWRLHFGPVFLGTINHAGQFNRPRVPRRRRAPLRSRMAPRHVPAIET
jgi:transposase InsO family protein